jgi:hypothetical protein
MTANCEFENVDGDCWGKNRVRDEWELPDGSYHLVVTCDGHAAWLIDGSYRPPPPTLDPISRGNER